MPVYKQELWDIRIILCAIKMLVLAIKQIHPTPDPLNDLIFVGELLSIEFLVRE